jgi:hypothetical protein
MQQTIALNNTNLKVKGKAVLCFNWAPCHEGVLGSGGTAPRILDLGTRWRWVVSFTPRPLYRQGKSTWYPLDKRLGVPLIILIYLQICITVGASIAQWYSAGLRIGWSGDRLQAEVGNFFLFTTVSRPVWDPPILLSNGYQGPFP